MHKKRPTLMQRWRKNLCAAKNDVKISLPVCKRRTCQIAGQIKKKDRGKESVAHFGGELGRKKKILCRKSVARIAFQRVFGRKNRRRYSRERASQSLGNFEKWIFILKNRTTFWNFEVGAVQKYANLVDLVKSFHTSVYLQKIGFDTAEKEPSKVSSLIPSQAI